MNDRMMVGLFLQANGVSTQYCCGVQGKYGLLFAFLGEDGRTLYYSQLNAALYVVHTRIDLLDSVVTTRHIPLDVCVNKGDVAILEKMCWQLEESGQAVMGEFGQYWAASFRDFRDEDALMAEMGFGTEVFPAMFSS